MGLSVTIITKNEERNIRRCLESVKTIADEIVVVDSFSTDATEAICAEYNVRFVKHPFEGHIQQKNYALTLATQQWILSLDADEALDDALRAEVKRSVQEDSAQEGYRMNRLTNYCGAWVHHCGWYPDTKLRLVKNGRAEWRGINPHDRLELISGGAGGKLKGDILHYSYYTIEDHLRQIEYFGKIASGELFRRRKRVGMFLATAKTVFQFIKSYFLKLGFLDGSTGFTISRLSAKATWRKYQLLRELYRNAPQA